jgi:hypothetical protein
MDTNFGSWMALQLQSDDSVTNNVNIICRLFEKKIIALENFRDSNSVLALMKKLAFDQKSLLITTGDKSDIANHKQSNVYIGNLKALTVDKYVQAVRWYARFLGKNYPSTDEFGKLISAKVSHITQSEIMITSVFDPATIFLFNGIVNSLLPVQEYINFRISRFLRFRDLAENKWSLNQFGLQILRPFLELVLRFLEIPLSTTVLNELKRPSREWPTDKLNIEHLFGADIDKTFGVGFRGALQFSMNSNCYNLIATYYKNDSGKICNNVDQATRRKKLFIYPLSESVSVYLFFYMAYCTNTIQLDGQPRNKKNRVFVGKEGGSWSGLRGKSIPAYTRDFVKVYLNETDSMWSRIGLFPVANSYEYNSKLLWLAMRINNYRCLNGEVDVATVISDSLRVGLRFGLEDQTHRSGPAILRDMLLSHNLQRQYINIQSKPPLCSTSTLGPLPDIVMDTLQAQMIFHASGKLVTKSRGMDILELQNVSKSPIELHDDLYSDDYKSQFSGKTVENFQKNRDHDTKTQKNKNPSCNQTMNLRKRKTTIPTIPDYSR